MRVFGEMLEHSLGGRAGRASLEKEMIKYWYLLRQDFRNDFACSKAVSDTAGERGVFGGLKGDPSESVMGFSSLPSSNGCEGTNSVGVEGSLGLEGGIGVELRDLNEARFTRLSLDCGVSDADSLSLFKQPSVAVTVTDSLLEFPGFFLKYHFDCRSFDFRCFNPASSSRHLCFREDISSVMSSHFL